MIKVLVKHGSNVNRKDEEGTPPLHSAVYGNTEWTASICDYLIEQGAVTPGRAQPKDIRYMYLGSTTAGRFWEITAPIDRAAPSHTGLSFLEGGEVVEDSRHLGVVFAEDLDLDGQALLV